MRFLAFLFPLLTLLVGPIYADGWPDSSDPMAGMGVNIHFTDAAPGELEMLTKAGFRWIRMDLGWASTEKKAGVYDFTAYDRLLASLDKFHLRAVLILDYTNTLYDNNKPTCTDEGRAAFARWAVAAVTHFKDRGVLWEIWNEPNGNWFWKPQPNADDYAKLAITVCKAIHEAAPDERTVGPALSGTNLDFVEVSAKAGVLTYWSGITIHPYSQKGPETFGPAYVHVAQLITKYAPPGQQIDVMCGELGWSTGHPEINETSQGQFLARLFLFDVMSRVPLTIYYDWRDDGVNPKDPEHHFGMVHHEYHPGTPDVYDPKPAYEAAKTYSSQLTGYKFKEREKTESPDDYLLSFSDGTSDCVVAWTAAQGSHPLTLPAPDGKYSVINYDGTKSTEVIASGGVINLTIDSGPQYLKLTK